MALKPISALVAETYSKGIAPKPEGFTWHKIGADNLPSGPIYAACYVGAAALALGIDPSDVNDDAARSTPGGYMMLLARLMDEKLGYSFFAARVPRLFPYSSGKTVISTLISHFDDHRGDVVATDKFADELQQRIVYGEPQS